MFTLSLPLNIAQLAQTYNPYLHLTNLNVGLLGITIFHYIPQWFTMVLTKYFYISLERFSPLETLLWVVFPFLFVNNQLVCRQHPRDSLVSVLSKTSRPGMLCNVTQRKKPRSRFPLLLNSRSHSVSVSFSMHIFYQLSSIQIDCPVRMRVGSFF